MASPDAEKLREAAEIARREARNIGLGDRAADYLLQTAAWLESRALKAALPGVLH